MNYKDRKVALGYTDIAGFLVRTNDDTYEIRTGGDGELNAYLVDENCEIPSHYSLALSIKRPTKSWAWFYDDDVKTLQVKGDEINIFRAGDYGIIIQVKGGGIY